MFTVALVNQSRYFFPSASVAFVQSPHEPVLQAAASDPGLPRQREFRRVRTPVRSSGNTGQSVGAFFMSTIVVSIPRTAAVSV